MAGSVAVVAAGVAFATQWRHIYGPPGWRQLIQFDVRHLVEIAAKGYSYSDSFASVVAFFPAFPKTARVVAVLAGIPVELACLLVAGACAAAAFATRMLLEPKQPWKWT